MEQQWLEVTNILDVHKENLIKAGIRKSTLELPKHDFEDTKYTNREVKDALRWLKTTFHEALLEWLNVRQLLPEAMWQQYETYEITDLREQNMLIFASKVLCKLWNQRPEILKKVKNASRRKKD